MKILIIEDEKSNADRLCRMLESFNAGYQVVGVAASNAETKAFFANANHATVDLILSDIQLGDGLSFESLRTLNADIPVIFTTAYDYYAVQAFRFNSIDYLLKPIEADDLQAALFKVKPTANTPSTTDAIAQLLEQVTGQMIRYRERFLIPHRADEFIIIPVCDVSYVTIQEGVVKLCTNQGKVHAISMSLEDVESQLDPQRFLRVNRQYIINVASVQKLSTYFLGKMRIHLTTAPSVEILVSKDKVSAVKKWLDR